jgi:hypothetical protein
MSDALREVFTAALSAGWDLQLREESEAVEVPPHIRARYATLPRVYVEFLHRVERCISPDRQTWLLTVADFDGSSGSAFKWNEFELMSLEATAKYPRIAASVALFWSGHIPVMMSVRAGYEVYSIRLVDGCVVNGVEPDFEDALVAFPDFVSLLRHAFAT